MTGLDSVTSWDLPRLPEELSGAVISGLDLDWLRGLIEGKLVGAGGREARSAVEIAVSDWLYDAVRRNVKRGRFFELEDVLSAGRADCLGYTKLLSVLGSRLALEAGIVEVVVDNAGRFVPHHVALINLASGQRRFVDAWYGSKNIWHQRLGAMVDGEIRDIWSAELDKVRELRGLPETCIEAITLYIRGNRHLEREELEAAIGCYSRAIEFYPNNTRAFYNRALAYDRMGMQQEAADDYAEAFKDEASTIRVLASINEIEGLIRLDEAGIGELEQDIYLWHRGFKTGEPVASDEIARIYGLPSRDVEEILSRVEDLCQC
ncbi:MAG: tetratricopeptide repeat protein [Chloroflexota bacterium]